jgi:hypothetical protein
LTNDETNTSPKLPLVLSILPIRAEIEDTASWTQPSGHDSGPQQPRLPVDMLRLIEKAQARRAAGKTGRTFTTAEARKRLGLPPS